ncbi:MAG: ABC transporter ATP-binding protein [Methanoregula sp.]|nr:ABC transporter ATP-binding protein [Methanoregula sp.]
MSPVITARNLTKSYGTVTAVDGISFSVEKGEIFGFLGPNGAGKTTTMKIIQCVSPRSGGTLSVFDLDPDEHPAEIKRRIGVVPQETNLDPDFTCEGNLMTYARYFDIPVDSAKKRVDELLAFVQLEEKRNVAIEKLSGGMKRRLILARALINSPELLVLDEPTIGLDPQARHLVWERLKMLQAQGSTIVLTTHYLDEAARLCDRLVIMDNGKILEEGVPADMVRHHAGEEIVEVERSDEVLACLEEMGIRFEIAADTVLVSTSDAPALARTLLERCRPKKMLTRPATLEDVFLKLTGRGLRD